LTGPNQHPSTSGIRAVILDNLTGAYFHPEYEDSINVCQTKTSAPELPPRNVAAKNAVLQGERTPVDIYSATISSGLALPKLRAPNKDR